MRISDWSSDVCSSDLTVEILTPDFKGKADALAHFVECPPDVFNHNLETVPRLYPTIRPGSRYFTSLSLLNEIKQRVPGIFTKSGLMVGLGETREEVGQVMDDLRAADVDFLTIRSEEHTSELQSLMRIMYAV